MAKIRYLVGDVDRSIDFYTQHLGHLASRRWSKPVFTFVATSSPARVANKYSWRIRTVTRSSYSSRRQSPSWMGPGSRSLSGPLASSIASGAASAVVLRFPF